MGKQQEGEDRCTYVYMYVCRFMSVDDEVYKFVQKFGKIR